MNATLKRILALIVAVALVATSLSVYNNGWLRASEGQEEVETQTDKATEVQTVTLSDDDAVQEQSVEEQEATQEEQTKEQAEEKEETEMPAMTFKDTSSNGIKVYVDAPEGAFPKGTTMKLKAVSDSEARKLYEESLDDSQVAVDAVAVDITFYDKDGKEIEPAKAIKVQLKTRKLKGDEFGIAHKADNGKVNVVKDNSSATGGAFSASDFSIYVTGGSEEIDNPDQLPVTFYYVFEDGTEAAKSNVVIVEKEETETTFNYTQEVAVPDGYLIKENEAYTIGEDGKSISISYTPTNDDDALSVTVMLEGKQATYTIKKYFQNGEDPIDLTKPETYTYDSSQDVVVDCKVGDTVTPEVPEVSGYALKELTPFTVDKEEGSVVNALYEKHLYKLIYNSLGGSYIPSEKVLYGDNVEVYTETEDEKILTCKKEEHTHTAAPKEDASDYKNKTIGCYTSTRHGFVVTRWSWDLTCDKENHKHTDACYTTTKGELSPIPTRLGYEFDGWYLDSECTQKAPKVIDNVQSDITVYAKWKPGKANYTVAYMKENLDGTYSYISSTTKEGTVDSTVTGSGTASFTNSNYYHVANSSSATVKADGSTVVYVYYDLNTYKLEFSFDDKNATLKMGGKSYKYNTNPKYTITCKFGEDISDKWPTATNFSGNKNPFYAWNITGKTTKFASKRFEVTSDMISDATNGSTTTYVANFDNQDKVIIHYMLQNADNNTYTDASKYYQEVYADGTWSAKQIAGYTNVKSENKKEGGVTNYYFYYDRDKYSIDYYSASTKLSSKTGVRFDKNINTTEFNFIPTRPADVDPEATFVGWYDNAECYGDSYKFDKMPASNLVLYAKWQMPQVNVTVIFDNGTETKVETIPKGSAVTDIETPTKEGYVFAGWFNKETGKQYDIGEPVLKDTVIEARWEEKLSTTGIIHYVTEDGTVIATDKNIAGAIGTEYTAIAKVITSGDYKDYVPDASTKTITLQDNVDNNSITFIYKPAAKLKYQVVYKYNGKVIAKEDIKDAKAPKFTVYPDKEIVKQLHANGYELKQQFIRVEMKNVELNEVVFELYGKEYRIDYDLQGGVQSGSNPTKYSVDKLPLSIIPPTKLGYAFAGWEYSGKDISVTGDPHNAGHVTIDKGSHGDLEFKAKWIKFTPYVGTYDAEFHTIKVSEVDDSFYPNIEYSEDGVNWSSEAPTYKNVGTYPVFVRVHSKQGWWSDALESFVKIDPIEITVTANPAEKKYGEADPEFTGTISDGVLEGESIGTVTYSRTNSEENNAGTYEDVIVATVANANANYKITTIPAKFDIKPRTLIFTSASDNKPYDGTPLTNNKVEVTGDGFVNGDGATFNVTGSQTKVGSSDNTFTYKFNEGTLASNYDVSKPQYGTLTVTKKSSIVVKIKGHNATYIYDGTTKTVTGYDVVEILDGDKPTTEYTSKDFEYSKEDPKAERMKAGTTYMGLNVEDFTNTNDNFDDVTFVVEDGFVTITKIETPITITANSNHKVYDGTALTDNGFTYTQGILKSGDTIVATIEGSVTNVSDGHKANTVKSYSVLNAKGEDVTACYTFTDCKDGDLYIEPKAVTLTSAKAEKTYDGKALTNSNVTANGFVGNDGATYDVTGSQTNVGTSNNTFTYKLNDGVDSSNYTISKVEGTLTVNKVTKEIQITANDGSKKYDGTELTFVGNDEGYTVTNKDAIVSTDRLEVTLAGSQKDVGASTNIIKEYKVVNAKGEDVTGNYTFAESINGTLTITARQVTLTSATDSKTYDGTALTNDEITVTGDGFVKGENPSYNVTGSITEIGSVNNDFTYTFKEGAKSSNYDITVVLGTLTVAPRGEVVVTITEHSGEYTYNGTNRTIKGYDVDISDSHYKESDFTFTGNDEVSGMKAGTYNMELKPEDFHNNNKNFDDVKFVIVDGKLKINPISTRIAIRAASQTKVYDGDELINHKYTYTEDVLANGDTIKVDFAKNSKITNVGEVPNRIVSVSIWHGDVCVSESYSNVVFGFELDGTLKVTPRKLVIETGSAQKEYDGTPLTKNEWHVVNDPQDAYDGFVPGEGFKWTKVTGSQTEIGESDNTFEYAFNDQDKTGISEFIEWIAGNPTKETRADNYNVTINPGKLVVNKVATPITITANSESKVYDGKPLVNNGYTYTSNVLKDGDVLTAVVEGSITDAGYVENKVTSYKVMRGNVDITKNYTFETPVSGKLTVEKRQVTLTSKSDTWVYDGTLHSAPEVKVTSGSFLEGDEPQYTNFYRVQHVTGAEGVNNTFDYLNDIRLDRLKNYDIKIEYGKLIITPDANEVVVTIKGNSATTDYDGSKHEVTGYTVESISDAKYYQSYIKFNGEAKAEGTDAGQYPMGLTQDMFSNNSKDFTNVRFVVIDGGLTINKVDALRIDVSQFAKEKVYDGTPLTGEAVAKLSDGYKPSGITIEYSTDGGITWTTNVPSITDVQKINVKVRATAKNFETATAEYSLEVTKRKVTLTSSNATKEYDGTGLMNHEVTVTSGSFVGNEYFEATTNGIQYEVGTSGNTFTYELTGGAKAQNYEITKKVGILEVTPKTEKITITAGSAKKEYDGTALTNANYTYTENVLANGDVLTAVVEGTITDVGTTANVVTSYKVMKGNKDVTDCYTFEPSVNGILEVAKRQVTLTSASASKTYDGNQLTKNEVTVTSGSFVEGEGFTFECTGKRTFKGESLNTFGYTLNANTKATNYEITKVNGKLTINAIETPIIVTANSDSKMYDGKPLINSGFTYTEGVLVKGDYVVAEVDGTIIDFRQGGIDNTIKPNSIKVYRDNGTPDPSDVTNCYTIGTPINGKLEITPRTVKLTSATDSKVYDGKPLTNSKVTASGDGFINGEGFTANVTGSQTKVGESDNKFTYYLNQGTKSGNYNISTEFGKLTVSEKGSVVVTITEKSDEVTYDGKQHTVTGYTVSSSDPLYSEGDFAFVGTNDDLTVQGTTIGYYDMGLTSKMFENRNPNFTDVKFEIVDGTLKINPIESDIKITASSYNAPYDGQTHIGTYSYTGTLGENDYLDVVLSNASIKDVGEVNNNITSYKVMHRNPDGSSIDVTNCYKNIETKNGKLKVTPIAITLKSETAEKTYDGTPLEKPEVKVSSGAFVSGEGFSAKATGSVTNVSEGPVSNAFEFTLNNGTNKDNYTITKEVGTLKINPLTGVTVTITGKTDSKEYNGSEQFISGYDISINNALYTQDDFNKPSQSAKVAKGTVVGSYNMNLSTSDFSNKNSNFKDVEFIVNNGVLNITPITQALTIKAKSRTQEYNGNELKLNDYELTSGKLANGDKLEVVVNGSITDVGTVVNEVVSVKVMNGSTDVTASYQTINKVNGSLEVTPREITFTSSSASKKYDGEPLTKDEVKITNGSFADGEGAQFRCLGSQTEVGTSKNNFEIGWNKTDATGLDEFFSWLAGAPTKSTKASNYKVTKVDGDLTVTAPNAVIVKITGNHNEFTYDGNSHEVSGYKVSIEGDSDYKESYIKFNGKDSVSRTLAGKTDMGLKVDDFANNNPNFKDVTFVIEDGYVNIKTISTKITITANSKSKYYDGEALIDPTYTFTKNVLLKGDELTAVVEGTITNAGTSKNTVTSYKVMRGNEDVTGCYTIETQAGTLTINKRTVVIESDTWSWGYDGKEHSRPYWKVTSYYNFVQGEGPTITFDPAAKVKDVSDGLVDNKFGYSFADEDTEKNYNIEKRFGTLKVTPQSINPDDSRYEGVTVSIPEDVVYNGLKQNQPIVVKDKDGNILVKDVDYTVSYSGETHPGDSTNVGKVNVYITGKGNYTGQVKRSYNITKAPLEITTESAEKVYDGTSLTNANGSIKGLQNNEIATLKCTGSQTNVGSTDNTYEIKWGSALESNYEIKKENLGKLTVTKQSIEPGDDPENPDPAYKGITVSDPEDVVYDGTEHAQTIIVKAEDGTPLVEGVDYKVTYSGDKTNVTDDGVTVTVEGIGNYSGTVEKTYKITPKDVEIVAASASKIYGETDPKFTGTVSGVVSGDDLHISFYRSNKDEKAGTYKDAITAKYDESNANYNVTVKTADFTITKVKGNTVNITSTADELNKVYDDKGVSVKAEAQKSGSTLLYSTDGVHFTEDNPVFVDAGTYKVYVKATNPDYEDSPVVDATIVISKRVVRVTGDGWKDKQLYTGSKYSTKEYSVEKESKDRGLVSGHKLTVDYLLEGTNVGSYTGAYTSKAKITDGGVVLGIGAKDVTRNYTVEYVSGKLTIKPQSVNPDDLDYHGVKVKDPDDTTYNGKTQEQKPIVTDDKGNVLVEGKDYRLEYSEDTTNAGEVEVTVIGIGNYSDTVSSTYKINKAKLTIEAPSATKVYDGTPLRSVSLADCRITNLMEGDMIVGITIKGTQTDVGTSENVASNAVFADGKGQNYDVEYIDGILTVTAAPADPSNPSNPSNLAKPNASAQGNNGKYDITKVDNPQTPEALSHIAECNCCALHFLIMLLTMIVYGIYTKKRKKLQERMFELREQLEEEKHTTQVEM